MTLMKKNLTSKDFACFLGISDNMLPTYCLRAISERNFRYEIISGKEREAVFLRVLKALDSLSDVAGPHRKQRWEDGWSENLREFIASGYDINHLVPKFVKKAEVIRLDGEYIMPEDAEFETNFVTILRLWLFSHWFSDVQDIYEFGCGTAHNLVALAHLFPQKELFGLDWAKATLEIIRVLREELQYKISGRLFDLVHPDHSFSLQPASGVFTIGTLEQIGKDFKPFIGYLIENRPHVCIHIETIYELYNPDILFDYIAVRYLEKRGYLQGLLTYLRELESAGNIEILALQRTFGSLFHDGYSYVIWRPLDEKQRGVL